MILLNIFRKEGIDSQDTDIAHIISVVIHRQYHALLSRLYI